MYAFHQCLVGLSNISCTKSEFEANNVVRSLFKLFILKTGLNLKMIFLKKRKYARNGLVQIDKCINNR